MNDQQPKNGTTLEEILGVLNASFTKIEDRFQRLEQKMDDGFAEIRSDIVVIKSDIVQMKSDILEMKSDIVQMKSDILEMKSDISDLKMDVRDLNQNMVRKAYLDGKVQEFKDDSMLRLRKANDKVIATVRTLRDKSVFSEAEAQPILSMEPFAVPR